MTNCLFYTIMFVLFLNVSFGSLRFSQVNRTFMQCYRGMFEASVITVDKNGEPIYPYYSQPVLNSYINNYFELNLKKFVNDYSLSVTYFNDDDSPCDSEGYARKVKISLDAVINDLFHYSKEQSYSITDKYSK